MVGLVRSGLLDLGQFEVTEFDLDHANDAVTHAAANGGPFNLAVIRS
jgi:alcohol dehydrogenase